MSEVNKKIHFFQVSISWDKFENILKEILKLDGESMYFWYKRTYLAELKEKPERTEGIFRELRTEDIPAKWKIGKREVHELWLWTNEWLAEATHFVYFKASKILAIEYNFHWTKANALEDYINQKIRLLPTVKDIMVTINIILRKDILEIVADLSQIKMVEFGISKNNINAVKNLDENLFDALKSASEFLDTEYIEIILKPAHKSRNRIMGTDNTVWFIQRIKNFFKHDLWNDTKFKIKWVHKRSYEVEYFDLLESKVESKVKAVKIWKSKMLNSQNMFLQIVEAFKDRKNYLLKITQ